MALNPAGNDDIPSAPEGVTFSAEFRAAEAARFHRFSRDCMSGAERKRAALTLEGQGFSRAENVH